VPDGVERLLTIVDLSEMLGIPVDNGWRHAALRPDDRLVMGPALSSVIEP